MKRFAGVVLIDLLLLLFTCSAWAGDNEPKETGGLRSNKEALEKRRSADSSDGQYRQIHLEPIARNCEHQVDSHGLRLFGNGKYSLIPDRHGNSVICFDVSNPADMRYLSSVSDERIRGAHYVTIGPGEQYGYTGAHGCFTVIDITNPANIAIHGHVRAGKSFSQEIVIAPANRTAYWALTSAHTIYAVDVSDKANPAILAKISGVGPPNYMESVAHLELHPHKPILFATSYRDHHLCSLDISSRRQITLLDAKGGHMISPHELVYYKGYLYIAVMYDNDAENPRQNGALVVYDASDPADLEFQTELKMGDEYPENQYPFDMLHGLRLDRPRKLLYASSQKNNRTQCAPTNSALTVFDVTDPARPVWLQSYQSCTWLDGAQQVDFHGDFLYTANHEVPSIASFALYGNKSNRSK